MAAIVDILKELTKELKKRLLPIPLVPQDFDPLTARPELLRTYAYPPRPPEANVAASTIWKALVSGPLPYKGWEDQVLPLREGQVPFVSALNKSGFRGRQETSLNWSGVVTHCEWNKPFETIFGMWQVPEVEAPSLVPDATYSCSVWVGMDGYLPTSASLPQIGTCQSVIVERGVATPVYEAWYQWWTRFGPSAPVIFQNLPVNPRELIACAVQWVNRTQVLLTIRNVTMGSPIIRQKLKAPTTSWPFPGVPLGSASGTTAEWVAERPRKIGGTEYLYPLPEFDTVTFVSAAVASSGRQRDFRPACVLRMVEPSQGKVEVISRVVIEEFPPGSFLVGPDIERRMGG